MANQRLVRSVRAGDLFLSQSTKWVHFGLRDVAHIENVTVLWPGGDRNTFAGIERGQRYVLEQGAPAPKRWKPAAGKRALALAPSPLATGTSETGAASVVLPAPIPLPRIQYIDPAGKLVVLDAGKSARLLILWSASCPHCLVEMRELAKHRDPLQQAGLELLALCVDGAGSETVNEAKTFIAKTGFPAAWGIIDPNDVERIQALQAALFDKTPGFAVPLSLLLNPATDVLAIYRGPLSIETLEHDVRTTVTASDGTLRNLAPPFPGRWFTTPANPSYIPEMIARRIQARYPEDALPYLHLAAARSSGDKKNDLVAELGRKHHSLARKFVTKRIPAKAEFHFRQSLDSNPRVATVHNDFGTMFAQIGRLKEGETHFIEALRLKPDYSLAKKNLARVRELLRGNGQNH